MDQSDTELLMEFRQTYQELFNKFIEDKKESNCAFGCKTSDDCPSIDSNFAGGCEKCAHYKRLN